MSFSDVRVDVENKRLYFPEDMAKSLRHEIDVYFEEGLYWSVWNQESEEAISEHVALSSL